MQTGVQGLTSARHQAPYLSHRGPQRTIVTFIFTFVRAHVRSHKQYNVYKKNDRPAGNSGSVCRFRFDLLRLKVRRRLCAFAGSDSLIARLFMLACTCRWQHRVAAAVRTKASPPITVGNTPFQTVKGAKRSNHPSSFSDVIRGADNFNQTCLNAFN